MSSCKFAMLETAELGGGDLRQGAPRNSCNRVSRVYRVNIARNALSELSSSAAGSCCAATAASIAPRTGARCVDEGSSSSDGRCKLGGAMSLLPMNLLDRVRMARTKSFTSLAFEGRRPPRPPPAVGEMIM
jgi:hypothetical protein